MSRRLALILALILVAALAAPCPAQEKLELPQLLLAAHDKLQQQLNSIDQDLARTAKMLARTGLDGWDTGRAMGQLRTAQPQIINCATISPQGVMVRIEPGEYGSHEGANIADQPQVAYMLKNHKPVLSNLFKTVEGFWGADLERPIIDEKGRFLGAISAMISPMAMTHDVVEALPAGGGLNAYLIQTDGLILYYRPLKEIGRNILETALFKSNPKARALAEAIIKKPQGMGGPPHFLALPGREPARRINYWTSVGLHGTKWRLGISDPITSKP